MHATQPSEVPPNENGHGVSLLMAELNHRIRNLLMTIEAAVRQTRSTNVEDYRNKLIHRISALGALYQLSEPYGGTVLLRDLLNQTMRPYSSAGARVLASGPDIELEP